MMATQLSGISIPFKESIAFYVEMMLRTSDGILLIALLRFNIPNTVACPSTQCVL